MPERYHARLLSVADRDALYACEKSVPVEGLEPCLVFLLFLIGSTPGFRAFSDNCCWALTGKLTGNDQLSLKCFIDLVHGLLLHGW